MNNKLSRLLRPGLTISLLILVLSSAAALFLKQYYLALADAGGVIVLFVYAIANSRSRRRQIIRYIQTTTDALDAALRSESPVPKVLLNAASGEILWASEQFCQMLGQKEELLGAPLTRFLPELDLSFLKEAPVKTVPELSYGNRRYHVYGNIVTPKDGEFPEKLANLLLIEMTEYLTVKEEYAGSRPMVAIILVDNYDELTNNLTDNDVSTLNVAVNNAVTNWTAGMGGLLRKIERNRYLYVFESRALQGMIDAKFHLLDDVRRVVNGSGVAATISLGIGKDGASYEEAYSFAALSIEMALSRGGDQAVVKDRYNFSFYGGRGKESSNRTKVKARVMAGSLSELIAQSSHIFIMGHSSADLDSLGASAGIQAMCRKRGKKANIIVDYQQNSVQEMLDLLAARQEYRDCFLSGESALIMADAKSLLIVVDTNRPDQVQYRPLLGSMSRIAVIDHHRRAADYISPVVLNLHEPSASSASELVAELLQYAVDPRDVLPEEAMALLAGIVLDTKHFSVRTSGRTFESAAFLRRLGADPVEVKKLLQSDFVSTVARYQIVQKARIYRGKIAIAVLDQPVTRVIAAQAADELVNISNVSASFVLFPQGDRIIVSARSIGEENVQVILESLGGGGNPATAGAQIPGKDMTDVVDRLVQSINHFYEQMTESAEPVK
ncbi:MAG: DHH family phosphoesterase [Oscillospiraceae bacterium]|nr:DHH family phosphoesterase [Oscillospiraceae bacterium]